MTLLSNIIIIILPLILLLVASKIKDFEITKVNKFHTFPPFETVFKTIWSISQQDYNYFLTKK